MKTEVIHIRDMQPGDVYIGRARQDHDGYFGNPFALTDFRNAMARRAVIKRFKRYFLKRIDEDPEFRRRVLELKGKRLACFCKPAPCHGDVIAEWLKTQGKESLK